MVERRVDAAEVSVEVKMGIENKLEVKAEDVGSECNGSNDVVDNGKDEVDKSHVLVSGRYVMVDDSAERVNVSEVLVELSGDEVDGLDVGQKAECEEAGKVPSAVENGVLLSNDAEESHVGVLNKDEMKTGTVKENGMVDEEAELGGVGNTSKAEETVQVESLDKLGDVEKTNIVDPNDHESESQQIISGGAVEYGDPEDLHVEASTKYQVKTDMVEEIEMVDEEAEQDEVEITLKVEDTIEFEYPSKLENLQKTVNVNSNSHESRLQQITSRGAVENGYADNETSDPRVEEKVDSKNDILESNESEHAAEELEKEIKGEYSTDKKENQDSEDLKELGEECNEEISLEKIGNQQSEVLVPSEKLVNLTVMDQDGHVSLIDDLLPVKKVTLNKESHLSDERHKLVIKTKVSSDVKENGECESLIHSDELEINREEQNNTVNVLQAVSDTDFANTVIPNKHVNKHKTAASATSKISPVNNSVDNIVSDASPCQTGTSKAANAISTEKEENGLESVTQDVIKDNDNETTEAEQEMPKDFLLNSVYQEEKDLAGEINDDLCSHLSTECAIEVVEPVTDTGDSNVPNDNEWPELSYYTTKRKISSGIISEVKGSQDSETREPEDMHMADRDTKEIHCCSPEDDNLCGHKKEILYASLPDIKKACPDLETRKEINLAVQSTNGVSSLSVSSTSSTSHSVSECVDSAANLENEVATSESGSKDDKTNFSGEIGDSKVETFSEEDSPLALVEVDKQPFFFLIKVPRFEDDEIREQIKIAQRDVDDKTKLRDSYKVPIQTKKTIYLEFKDALEAAKLKEKAARDSLKEKRREIDAAQAVIDKVNNAMTVDDIDDSHRIQHETIPLGEEKQLIREIKRLKHFKEQLSSSIGTQEELQEALDQKDKIRDHLKSLKRELNLIRSDVQRTEVVTKAAKKKCFDEYAELNNLQMDFKAADGVRQEAYLYLVSLRRELAQKNKIFRRYKDTEKLANDYALSGDKKSLHSLCLNQVETVMELWNTNEQFRNDYEKYNARSTIRRLKTFDGRSHGVNEEPPSLPNIRNDRISHSAVVTNSLSQPPPPEEFKIHVSLEAEKVANEPVLGILEKKVAKTRSKSITAVSEVSNGPSLDITPVAEEEAKKTKEEEQAEEIRKKEEEAKLMEQLQLDERTKAKEALERKKRMTERAQARAMLRAKKEAEQREKEREKRLRKKEKRKDDKDNGTEKDFTAANEAGAEVTKEACPAEKPITKMHHKPLHYVKGTKTSTMPINLRNRHRKRMQMWMWMWMGVAAFTAVALVLIWFWYLSYLKERKRIDH